MAATTDFNEWLGIAQLKHEDDYELIYSLYIAVSEGQSHDPWKISEKDGKLFLSCRFINDPLMIASDDARDTFLSLLLSKYCIGNDIESWYNYQVNMHNPHA